MRRSVACLRRVCWKACVCECASLRACACASPRVIMCSYATDITASADDINSWCTLYSWLDSDADYTGCSVAGEPSHATQAHSRFKACHLKQLNALNVERRSDAGRTLGFLLVSRRCCTARAPRSHVWACFLPHCGYCWQWWIRSLRASIMPPQHYSIEITHLKPKLHLLTKLANHQ